MTGAKISTKGIWGMRVDSNPPISVLRPLAVQNHNPAPDRDVCLVAIRWLVDLNRRAYLKCLWLRFFLHFHFISTVDIWFISYIINTHFFHGNIWTHNWPAPNVSGFIAQLVEHRTGNREVTGSNPVEVLIFFFFRLLHCDDHFLIFISFPQFIYDLFHKSLTLLYCIHDPKRFFTTDPKRVNTGSGNSKQF